MQRIELTEYPERTTGEYLEVVAVLLNDKTFVTSVCGERPFSEAT